MDMTAICKLLRGLYLCVFQLQQPNLAMDSTLQLMKVVSNLEGFFIRTALDSCRKGCSQCGPSTSPLSSGSLCVAGGHSIWFEDANWVPSSTLTSITINLKHLHETFSSIPLYMVHSKPCQGHKVTLLRALCLSSRVVLYCTNLSYLRVF